MKKKPSKITISFRVFKADAMEISVEVRKLLTKKGYRLYEKAKRNSRQKEV